MLRALPLALVLACAPAPHTADFASALDTLDGGDASTPSCAPAPSGSDQRLELQAYFGSACQDPLPAGAFLIATPAAPRARVMLSVARPISGAGAATILTFVGDGGGLDWVGLEILQGASLAHLGFDTSGLTDTDEQAHAIRGDGPLMGDYSPGHPATIGRFTELTVHNPINAGGSPRKGDCFQLVGYDATAGTPDRAVTGVEVDHLDLEQCARSGVGLPGGLHDSAIHDINCIDVNDQCVDTEPGGGGSADVEMYGIRDAPVRSGVSSFGIQIDSISRLDFHDNTLQGRAIAIQDCDTCRFHGDVVDLSYPLSNYGAIDAMKDCHNLEITGESLTREAAATAGPVLRLAQNASGAPSDVTVSGGTTLVQHSAMSVLTSTGVSGLVVSHVALSYDAAGTSYGIDVVGGGGVAGIRSSAAISDVIVAGKVSATVRVSGSYAGDGPVSLTRVTAPTATQGLRCENITAAAGIAGPINYRGNAMPQPVGCGTLILAQ